MVNSILAVFRIIYIIAGLLCALFFLLTPISKADNPSLSDFVLFGSFILNGGLAFMFFYISYILGKRKKLAIPCIFVMHSIMLVVLIATFIGMSIQPESYIYKKPFFYVLPFIFWICVSLLPIYFFSRPEVREKFN